MKNIAYTYHSTSDKHVREAAQRAWEEALEACIEKDGGLTRQARQLRSKKAA